MKCLYLLISLLALALPLTSYAAVCAIDPSGNANDAAADHWGTAGGTRRQSQPFTVSTACTPTNVGIRADIGAGAPTTGVITLFTGADGAGALGTSSALTGLSSGVFSWATSTISTSQLAISTTYYFVTGRTDAYSDAAFWNQSADTTVKPYGICRFLDGGSGLWSNCGGADIFEVDGTIAGGTVIVPLLWNWVLGIARGVPPGYGVNASPLNWENGNDFRDVALILNS